MKLNLVSGKQFHCQAKQLISWVLLVSKGQLLVLINFGPTQAMASKFHIQKPRRSVSPKFVVVHPPLYIPLRGPELASSQVRARSKSLGYSEWGTVTQTHNGNSNLISESPREVYFTALDFSALFTWSPRLFLIQGCVSLSPLSCVECLSRTHVQIWHYLLFAQAYNQVFELREWVFNINKVIPLGQFFTKNRLNERDCYQHYLQLSYPGGSGRQEEDPKATDWCVYFTPSLRIMLTPLIRLLDM